MTGRLVAAIGLAGVLYITVSAFHLEGVGDLPAQSLRLANRSQRSTSIRLLAIGDVNLGREVGQRILQGDTLFPFVFVKDILATYDVVFANLECTLSDQHGETQNPRNNLIFTGPPAGASSLRLAGISVVSTANNHALDYGFKAQNETIQYLSEAGVQFAGTATHSASLFDPTIVIRKNIRIAFFACTDVMNIQDRQWTRYVAEADTTLLLPRIRAYRDSVDFIIVSYHGGEEYAERPTTRMKEFARLVINGGADLFLGHHPHVPYGVEELDGKYIVHSLGNFVFRQPARFWTQRSIGFSAEITKDTTGTRVSSFSCLPVSCGLQPQFVIDKPELNLILERVKTLSSGTMPEQFPW